MKPDLLPLETAISQVLETAHCVGGETIRLVEAAGRMLCADVSSPMDLPPESASLMDGYAFRSAGAVAGAELAIAMTVPAGRAPERALRSGECARIFTGGVLPEGADAVVKQEDVDAVEGRVRFRTPLTAGEHVRGAGSDAKKGDKLLSSGTALDGGALSLIASLGIDLANVARRPLVAILATGDELRRPGSERSPGAIFESNTVGLAAQATEAGAKAEVLGIAPDDPAAIVARLRSIDADIFVTSGGASVGDYDFASEVLDQLGGKRVFWQVAIRPGRPILFGTIPRPGRPDALFFALPGNPGASALTFDLLVRPAIRKVLGAQEIRRRRVKARLQTELTKPKGLVQLARGRCVVREQQLIFEPAPLQGSMSIRSLAGLGAVAFLPAEVSWVEADTVVEVELWGAL